MRIEAEKRNSNIKGSSKTSVFAWNYLNIRQQGKQRHSRSRAEGQMQPGRIISCSSCSGGRQKQRQRQCNRQPCCDPCARCHNALFRSFKKFRFVVMFLLWRGGGKGDSWKEKDYWKKLKKKGEKGVKMREKRRQKISKWKEKWKIVTNGAVSKAKGKYLLQKWNEKNWKIKSEQRNRDKEKVSRESEGLSEEKKIK